MKLVLIGGFLGSGKTTAIVNACRILLSRGKKVAVITNDQGDQQVDGAFVRSQGITGYEVINGCFCCQFVQLDGQLDILIREYAPDYIFAESVGSCTDLVATLAIPLARFRPDLSIVIPVFADAELLGSILENRSAFIDESVRYIYRKQLEEADFIVLNKKDTLSPPQTSVIRAVIAQEYKTKIAVFQDSRRNSDVMQWLRLIDRVEVGNRTSLDIDYGIYGEGEARLAWADKEFMIMTEKENAVTVARFIIGRVFDRIQEQRLTIGHLKFFIQSGARNEKVSFTTTSTSSSFRLSMPDSRQLALVVNARIQAEPQVLSNTIDSVINQTVGQFECTITKGKQSVFSPGQPTPTYRIQTKLKG